MTDWTLELQDEQATVDAGCALGRACLADGLKSGLTVFLRGQLGAGKTTLCRGVLRAFGHGGAVKSPTYTLVEPYDFANFRVYHFDLYRLGEAEELEYMGVRDYFGPGCLSLLEWPERGADILPQADLNATLRVVDKGRELHIAAESASGESVLAAMRQLI